MQQEQAGANDASADMKRRMIALRGPHHPLSSTAGHADGPGDLAARLQGLRAGGSTAGSASGTHGAEPRSSRSIGARVSGVVGRLYHPHKAAPSEGASHAAEPTDSDIDSQQLDAIQGGPLRAVSTNTGVAES